MANHLDLEEQEQLDQLKHFWKQYGAAITWALIVILGGYAGWNGYQVWQRNQSVQAAALYDELDRVLRASDVARVDRAFADMQERYGRTSYAGQAGLLVARHHFEAGRVDASKAALTWVVEKASDPGIQAIARLRLASILAHTKSYDDALKLLDGPFPASFAALAADRKGDVLALQARPSQAVAAWDKAYQALDARSDYRRLVEVKLNAHGAQAKPSGADIKGAP
ncbi:MAG: tetratricopeptide repeat protein [Rhodoferax sp.]|nr:tetratricopeptide repeat protein [Rhodoferax sp.]